MLLRKNMTTDIVCGKNASVEGLSAVWRCSCGHHLLDGHGQAYRFHIFDVMYSTVDHFSVEP